MSSVPAHTAVPFQFQLQQYSNSNPSNLNFPRYPNSSNPIKPIVLWTSSIARYCRNDQLPEAAAEFTRMRLAGVEPNHITFITLLSGCADFPSHSLHFGASLHGYVRKLGLDTGHVMVGTALIAMYAKCAQLGLARNVFDYLDMKNSVTWNTMLDGYMRNGEIELAIELFDEMPTRDAISWTALINGFLKQGYSEQALECFHEMQCSGIEPDYVSIIAVLAACADLGALSFGLWVNRFLMQQEFKDNIRISNSLIDMYSRCGCIEFARQVFDKMPKRTLVSWNSMIVGFAINGFADESLEFFDAMQKEGFKADGVSYTGALTACSHAGLVNKGLELFDNMKRVHRITPRIEHYGCIVDLYSRAGRLDEALNVIETMPMKPNEVVLGSLLAACRTHGDVSLAERLIKYLFELDPGGDSSYVLLSNIYAAVGRWEGANKVRRTMKARGVQKKPGFSSIEIDGKVHEFVAGDKYHADADNIYSMLEVLFHELKICGYVPETATLMNGNESSKEY
ncbi:pentatricopeptide repeat-containing protein At1g05750, chloroplastic [Cucurbita pepo subsp. pepo]|uniref:pentatricopeptide repeat-containing protein At1g05750, chloroplastic n=1 Tax=Cucurbita pepo subsp. pepo TaxID=3664 RepID=UPI000C9D42AB|nr:pentatricopeptide repeat-containing protein At1g05750, chloroplastic [Cucurbita pepo subsp. pepo]